MSGTEPNVSLEIVSMQLKNLIIAARIGVEFIDHWVSEHSMDSYPTKGTLRDKLQAYPGSARETAAVIRAALTHFQDIAPNEQAIAQDWDAIWGPEDPGREGKHD